ncbi:hypothetical protein [Mycobacterium sp. NAZ190054]|uniref:hypothetical protein n=1 Tax=Mycobacterium sp. NAZ190054 TaxID=1747766 RepID=UPI000799EACF|nr:hypothetical protein [Mycobacterium sp. NAZ190054]KWX65591.1 hypothetical protein ASJ79_01095 [Mycobacterium sp. NAZ190054]
MTLVELSPGRHRLPASVQSVRQILAMAGCGLPAAALHNPAVAVCVRAQGLAVTVCSQDELALAQAGGVRPLQVVLRCRDSATIRRAAALGVVRFVVSTARHVDVLASCPQSRRHVYLEEGAPVVLGERPPEVVGMHCDISGSPGPDQWGAAAEQLLGRIALMRDGGSTLPRISMSGGSAQIWLGGHTRQLRRIAAAVDEALDDGCARWRLPRPAVALTPLTT